LKQLEMPKTGPEFTPWEIKTKNEEKKNETKRIFLRKKRESLFEVASLSSGSRLFSKLIKASCRAFVL
jgi:hypothetical protein